MDIQRQHVPRRTGLNPAKTLLVVLILMVLGLQGCAQVSRAVVQVFPYKEGCSIEASPDETSGKYSCYSFYEQGMIVLEQMDVTPTLVFPGEKINLRIRYALCPALKPLPGKIIRKITLGDQIIYESETEFDFKPGTWVCDTSFTFPSDIKIGVYRATAELSYGKKKDKRTADFEVKEKSN
ncbi:MAG: hypothetical protein HQK58_10885 [Deltaproteobacteria bacterium]|nr:hypothetical protein [Deltaproteobacteria bacterium]